MAKIISGLDIAPLLWHSKNEIVRRVAALLTFTVAAFFGGYAVWFLSGAADVDLSPGGKAQMGVLLALTALIFAWLGWALLRPRR